jgi:hypothetical protein
MFVDRTTNGPIICYYPHRDDTFVKLDRENYRRYRVEDPNQHKNEYVRKLDEDSSNLEILAFYLALEYKEAKD